MHPNVTSVIDVDTLTDGTPFMVMEYLEGRDLARELDKRGPLPCAEAVGYILQASRRPELQPGRRHRQQHDQCQRGQHRGPSITFMQGGGLSLRVSNDAVDTVDFDVFNTTVAFNDSGAPDGLAGGLIVDAGNAMVNVRIGHSLFAGNVGDPAYTDVACFASAVVTYTHANYFGSDVGANDCSVAATVPPIIDVGYTPGPLADNGGFTLTHALGMGGPDGVGAAGGCVTPAGDLLNVDQRNVQRVGARDIGVFTR